MKIILVIVLACLPVIAQEKVYPKQKFGSLVAETYLLREGVFVTVIRSQNGEMCEMMISPESPTRSLYGRSLKTFDSNALSKIIDELVPLSQRGKLVQRMRDNADCFIECCGYTADVFEYERIYIHRIQGQHKGQERFADIRWKNTSCSD